MTLVALTGAVVGAEGVSVEESRPLVKAQPMSEDAGSWVAVVAPEDLPKGALYMRAT